MQICEPNSWSLIWDFWASLVKLNLSVKILNQDYLRRDIWTRWLKLKLRLRARLTSVARFGTRLLNINLYNSFERDYWGLTSVQRLEPDFQRWIWVLNKFTKSLISVPEPDCWRLIWVHIFRPRVLKKKKHSEKPSRTKHCLKWKRSKLCTGIL